MTQPTKEEIERAEEIVRQSLLRKDLRAIIASALATVRERGENPCSKIFDHKWLDPKCVGDGCQSLILLAENKRLREALEELAGAAADIHPTAPSSASITRLHAAIDAADALRGQPPLREGMHHERQ